MDVNNSGHVSWPEFGHLWRKLTHYKDLFCQCDVENLGFLQVTQLCNCLRAADYPVTKPVRRLLCRRYGDTAGRVDLVGFTCCFLRMDFTMKTFNKLGKGAPGISLSADQWMIISAYF
ncbi:calpain small subunit 1 [Callorhinchus milii]|nr:calpain small subunit 1 [Callorhinchus milii]|eukprot:gi/632960915/ref/XP_007896466.1/ PREDICTED: calpain-13 [Callorhinchus milii]